MIVEEFDFKKFFNNKYVTNIPRAKEYGIGAVSIITPSQAITRINGPDIQYGREPGLGHHDFEELAKKILGIKEEKSEIPEGLSLEDVEKFAEWAIKTYYNEEYMAKRKRQDDLLKAFLDSVIKITYSSKMVSDFVTIELPTFNLNDSTWDSTLKISEGMYEAICEILTDLENSGLSSDKIEMQGISSNKSYEQLKQYLKGLVDPNFTFPFKENKIVERQSIQEDDEHEK